MSIQHNIRQGECLSSIAKRYGFADWRTIYEDPQNTEFRQSRPNPNLIYPGDQLWIPDKSPKKLPISTEKKHTLQLKSSLTRLRLVLKDEEGKPIEVLFGALAMKQWGIRLNPAEEKLDLSHYPKEFVEF